MQTLRAQRVLSTFRGSSWPVLVDTGDQKVVVKLRGTAEGARPLVAELVVGALADALGLLTPARYLVELPPHLPSDDPHEELRDLLERSHGSNLGLRFLEGFRNVTVPDALVVRAGMRTAGSGLRDACKRDQICEGKFPRRLCWQARHKPARPMQV